MNAISSTSSGVRRGARAVSPRAGAEGEPREGVDRAAVGRAPLRSQT
jgi:hypothetical protein